MFLCVYVLIKAFKCSPIHYNSALYDSTYLNEGNQTSQKKHAHTQSAFGITMWKKDSRGMPLTKVYAWALSARVLASVFASDRTSVSECAWSRGKLFSVRKGFYGGFAHIDHKLSSISSRLRPTHTCKHTLGLNNNNAWHTNQTTLKLKNKRDSDFFENKLVIFNMFIFLKSILKKGEGKSNINYTVVILVMHLNGAY